MDETVVREHLKRMLGWGDAHVTFDEAVRAMPPALRGVRPEGFPHSVWELIEHIRIAQADILEFCVNADYAELDWPEQYWPPTAGPPDDGAWEASIDRVKQERAALQDIATNTRVDLTASIPHGSGQTYLRELLLVMDHTSQHVGQIVAVRRLLGAWRAP